MTRIDAVWVAICSVLLIAQTTHSSHAQSFHEDRPFVQDFAEKIPLCEELSGAELSAVRCDRNGRILVLSNKGLLQLSNGQLVPDRQYRPLLDMKIRGLDTYRDLSGNSDPNSSVLTDQFVYLTDELVFANAWAGRFSVRHGVPDAGLFRMGSDFGFLLAGKDTLGFFSEGKCVDTFETAQPVRQLLFDPARSRYLLLGENQLDCFVPGKKVTKVFEGRNLNCLELIRQAARRQPGIAGLTGDGSIIIGTPEGYIELDADSFGRKSAPQKKLPCTDI
ncbi:MAG: hypothetical protein AAB403_16095, partial [Planctomycetota bacterium]